MDTNKSELAESTLDQAADSKEVLRELNEFALFHKLKKQFELVKEFKNAQKQAMFEIRLIIGNETYTAEGRSIKAAQRVAAALAMSTTSLEKPPSKEETKQSEETSFVSSNKKSERRAGLLDDFFDPNIPFEYAATRYFDRRLSELLPSTQQFNEMFSLIKEVEYCLKIASDSMTAKTKEMGIRVCDPTVCQGYDEVPLRPDDEFRMLKGVMRIGNMAKNVMLSTDREVCLVLLCAQKPTVSLLNEICAEMQQVQPDFCLVTDEHEACLRVEYNSIYQAKVYVSSILLRQENFNQTTNSFSSVYDAGSSCTTGNISGLQQSTTIGESADQQTYCDDQSFEPEFNGDKVTEEDNPCPMTETHPNEEKPNNDEDNEEFTSSQIEELTQPDDTNDFLPVDVCLHSLAEVRHAKWFQVKFAHRPNAVSVLRLVRHLQQIRPNSWGLIPQYAFELLLDHCGTLSIPNPPLLWIFRKLLEMLAAGILYDNSLGVFDPCERVLTNAVANVSLKAKEIMTGEAGYCMRLLVLRRLDDMLGFGAGSQTN